MYLRSTNGRSVVLAHDRYQDESGGSSGSRSWSTKIRKLVSRRILLFVRSVRAWVRRAGWSARMPALCERLFRVTRIDVFILQYLGVQRHSSPCRVV